MKWQIPDELWSELPMADRLVQYTQFHTESDSLLGLAHNGRHHYEASPYMLSYVLHCLPREDPSGEVVQRGYKPEKS